MEFMVEVPAVSGPFWVRKSVRDKVGQRPMLTAAHSHEGAINVGKDVTTLGECLRTKE